MSQIQVLDKLTIDKIAAGEVIERPASIVKELVENAIDAGSTAVTVEIEDGGISYIRVSDNGCGIPKEEVRLAFLRHSTSKIRTAEDLESVASLGFRGEALSSIAAVARVELLTKTKDSVYGTRYCIEGGEEKSLEDAGATDGTTFMIRQIFYNTPARRKFLKTPMTEASHISELMTRLALSHPEVSIRFVSNGQTRLSTSGNGRLKDVIYHVFGREVAKELIEVETETANLKISGYIGKPLVSRGNRNYENYYINGRYVKSKIIAKAIEDAYKGFTMQHKYPFVVLHLTMTGGHLDVNVHPTKMELRFDNQQSVYEEIYQVLLDALTSKELIPEVSVPEAAPLTPQVPATAVTPASIPTSSVSPASIPTSSVSQAATSSATAPIPEMTKQNMTMHKVTPPKAVDVPENKNLDYFMKRMQERVNAYHRQDSQAEVRDQSGIYKNALESNKIQEAVQTTLFEDLRVSEKPKEVYKLIGQVFDTYWLVEYREQLYIIDQHAAHERVLYEKTLKQMQTREYTSQYVSPPIVLNLSMQEEETLKRHFDVFARIGFEIESFGASSYAIRAVPDNLFGITKESLFIEMLDSMNDEISTSLTPELVTQKVASMSCKAAVKGNHRLSAREVETLIDELLTLDNPYHCPHGRPTIIAMTKRELEKKFKRIV